MTSSYVGSSLTIILCKCYSLACLGVEYVGIVEYSPFQRIPKKKKKKDPKCGTIETDPIFQEFLESLKDQEVESQPKLEYSYPVNEGLLCYVMKQFFQ